MNCLLAAESCLTWQCVVLVLGIVLIIAVVVCVVIHTRYIVSKERKDRNQHLLSLSDAFFDKQSLIVKIKDIEYDAKFNKESLQVELQEKPKNDK